MHHQVGHRHLYCKCWLNLYISWYEDVFSIIREISNVTLNFSLFYINSFFSKFILYIHTTAHIENTLEIYKKDIIKLLN